MNSKKVCLRLVVAATLFAAIAPNTAAAQWAATSIGVAEVDTDNTLLLLAGVSAGPGGRGWRPRIGIQGYFLTFDGVTDRVNVTTVRPYVGVRNLIEGGSFGVNVGYAFSNRDLAGGRALVEDRGDGVVLSGGWDHWGTGGPYGFQALGAYNFGSSSLWTRGRATKQLSERANGGQTRLGGEVAFLNGEGYSAWQPGAIMEFHDGSGRILGLGAGMKFFEGGENAVYFKVEGLLPLGR